jgi:small GTP-binding protein
MSNDVMTIKAIIIGEGAVGKTSLRRTYMGESFEQNYLMTIGADFSMKSLELDMGNAIRFQLWDLAGQQSTRNIITKHCIGAIGAIAVYSRTDRRSVEDLHEWISIYFNNSGFTGQSNPVLIMGNKSDLDYEPEFISDSEHEEIIENIRKKFPGSTIVGITTSALNGINVDTAFDFFGQQCYDWMINKLAKHQKKVTSDYSVNFPFAALFTMNDQVGPLWAASSPVIAELDLEKAQTAMIKLIVGLNPEELVEFGTMEGQMTWPDPDCVLMHLSFAIPNEKARGGQELYMLGLGVSKDIIKLVENSRSTIDGILQAGLNEFAKINIVHSLDLPNRTFSSFVPELHIEVLTEMLDNLRKSAYDMIFGQ